MARRARIPHYDDPDQLGRRLHDARVDAGLSQRDLAFPGCSAAYISRIERGERTPSLQVLRELARRIGVTESVLAYGGNGLDPAVERRIRDLEVARENGDRSGLAKAYQALARAASKAGREATVRH